jgi:TrmH family RNA methyltransferase
LIRIITSESNSVVKLAKKLRDKRGRDKEGSFLIEGANLLAEARKSGARITHILLRENEDSDIMSDAEPEIDTVILGGGLFDELADTVTPQGVMAIVRKPESGSYFSTADVSQNRGQSIVVLDRLQDPGNVGGIIRSAAAAGLDGIVSVGDTADVFSRKVVRATAGAIFRIPIRFAPDGETVLKYLRTCGIRSVACTMTGDRLYSEAALTGDVAIIVGNEGGGLSPVFLAGADEHVYIPMREGVESLNASVAAAIVMFEKKRQEAIC